MICHNYRSQHSCGKVMFLHLSMILFTWGYQADIPLGRQPPPPPGRHPSRVDTPSAQTSPGQTHPLLQQTVHILLECIYLLAPTKLGQGNIFTNVCQEFYPRGGVYLSACWDTGPPGPGTPAQDQVHPPKTRYTPPPKYGQRAAGTHPTGMHSCCISFKLFLKRYFVYMYPDKKSVNLICLYL